MSRGRQWTEVVPGFFSISVADVNCYLVQTADGLTLFDAGLPRSRGVLRDLLGHLAAKETDINAVVLTGTSTTSVSRAGCTRRGSPCSSTLATHTWLVIRTATVRPHHASPTCSPIRGGSRPSPGWHSPER